MNYMKDPEFRKEIQKHRDIRFKNIQCEAGLENYFFEVVTEAGAFVIKFNPTENAGLPDLIVFHQGCAWLVELKMPKGVVRPHQKIIHEKFAHHGFKVLIIRTKEQITDFIETLNLL